MLKQEIKDNLGMIIGYLEKIGNKTRILDRMYKPLGSYDPLTNEVHDNMGRLIGRGIEWLGTLLKK